MTDLEYYITRFHDCLEASPISANINLRKLCALIEMIHDEACLRVHAEYHEVQQFINREKEKEARLRGDGK